MTSSPGSIFVEPALKSVTANLAPVPQTKCEGYNLAFGAWVLAVTEHDE